MSNPNLQQPRVDQIDEHDQQIFFSRSPNSNPFEYSWEMLGFLNQEDRYSSILAMDDPIILSSLSNIVDPMPHQDVPDQEQVPEAQKHGTDEDPALELPAGVSNTGLISNKKELAKSSRKRRASYGSDNHEQKKNKKMKINHNQSSLVHTHHDMIIHGPDHESSSFSCKNKLDHNAKERIRRMKLNASYLALRALLLPPDSGTSCKKKRWSSADLVAKALKYIPELEEEIRQLKSKKSDIMMTSKQLDSETKIKDHHQYVKEKAAAINGSHKHQKVQNRHVSLSLNKVGEDEVMVQICMKLDEGGGRAAPPPPPLPMMTKVLQRVEEDDEDFKCFKSASITNIYECGSTPLTCHHLHIQINQSSYGADEELMDKLRIKIYDWMK